MEDIAIINIVVSGSNVMGNPLCRVDGIIREKGKKLREISYHGPVTSAHDVADAIQDLFKEET